LLSGSLVEVGEKPAAGEPAAGELFFLK